MDWSLYARLHASGIHEDLIASTLGISVLQLRKNLSYAGVCDDEPDDSDSHWYRYLLDVWHLPPRDGS